MDLEYTKQSLNDTLELKELQKFNSELHNLKEFISVYTRYRELKSEGRRDLAEAYYKYAKRLHDELPDKWKCSI